jgi:hypothetical protein
MKRLNAKQTNVNLLIPQQQTSSEGSIIGIKHVFCVEWKEGKNSTYFSIFWDPMTIIK